MKPMLNRIEQLERHLQANDTGASVDFVNLDYSAGAPGEALPTRPRHDARRIEIFCEEGFDDEIEVLR